ncbi:translation initiation factor IF-2 [Buchnera aphidicola]|uniref:translation initiation factor IF-2 n=1 Tax=Buchnera aphidicola TaxID=9 RepID=UPI0031B83042
MKISKNNKNIKFNIKNKKNNINKKKKNVIKKSYNRFILNKNEINNNYKNILKQNFKKPLKFISKNIFINKKISVLDLSKKMSIKSKKVLKFMDKAGISGNVNDFLNQKDAILIIKKFGYKPVLNLLNDDFEKKILKERNINLNIKKKIRPPIVTIMGHVDHGKTSLIDYIRSTKIINKEFGGITQHIGSYHVNVNNKKITFIDTPGHAAFKLMRLRGAKITDIIVLVVSSDDGVMPQTIEVIKHAKLYNVPIIVAINKIDKCNNTTKIKNELSKYDIISEEWGGENIFVEISAKFGTGVKDLLNYILLQAEILELKVFYNCMAKGLVLESYINKGSGPVANILIKEGILYKGDVFISGVEYGKIRSIKNEYSLYINKAYPSMPVEISGLSGILSVGDEVLVIKNEKIAKEIINNRKNSLKNKKFNKYKRLNIDKMFSMVNDENISILNIILKVDVQGSLEIILNALKKISNNKVKINIVYSGVGNITKNDLDLSITSNAVIISFNIHIDNKIKFIIKNKNIIFYNYFVIYKLIDAVKILMSKLLKPLFYKNKIGVAEVKNIFNTSKSCIIAGCIIIEGIIKINSSIKIIRNRKKIFKGKLESLRHFKDNVQEVSSGLECGVGIKNFNDIKIGDILHIFEIIKK